MLIKLFMLCQRHRNVDLKVFVGISRLKSREWIWVCKRLQDTQFPLLNTEMETQNKRDRERNCSKVKIRTLPSAPDTPRAM